MEGEYEVRKSFNRKGRWGAGHAYKRNNWGCEVMEQIYMKSDEKSRLQFVSSYLDNHKEVAYWDSSGHVSYTANKRKRWMLTKIIKNVFKEDAESLEQEPYRVVVVERDVIQKHCDKNRPELAMNAFDSQNLPVPNKKKHQTLRGKPIAPIREGKKNGKTHLESLIDVPSLEKSSPPQLVYQAWEVQSKTKHIVRGDKSIYGYTPWHRYTTSYDERKKKDAFSAKECIDDGIHEYSNDGELCEDKVIVTDNRYNHEIDTNNNVEYDYEGNPIMISLQDIIERKNNSMKRIQKNKIASKTNMYSMKGKMIYDPDFIPNETYNSFEEYREEKKNEDLLEKDNWLEKLEEDAKIIVFLDVNDVLVTVPEGWRKFDGFSDPHRVMLEHMEGGVVILIEIRETANYVSAECTLTVMNLSGESFTDILDVFSSMSTVQEIADAAVSLCSTIKKNDYLETEDYVIVRESLAHLSMKQSPLPSILPLLPMPSSECGICFSHPDEAASLSCLIQCGHSFCSTCWQHYLTSQVRDGQTILTCPAYLCASPVDLPTTAWYLGAEYYKLFLRLVVSSQVSSDKRYIWCPKPSCGRVVFLKNPDVHHVQCLCHAHWCPKCREEQHWPASCKDKVDFKAYQFKMEEYQQLESSVKVRACPKCHTLWEKMYGCNHMSCTCGAHFCWGCGEEHIGAMGYACGGMKVPLESFTIVPLPTEKFSMRRIKAFQMAEKLNKRSALIPSFTKKKLDMFCVNSSSQSRDIEMLVHRFLSVDRNVYFESLGRGMISFQQSSQYRSTNDIISKATLILKQGRLLLANAYLMPESAKVSNNAKLRILVGTLEELSGVLYKSKVTKKNVEKHLEKIIK